MREKLEKYIEIKRKWEQMWSSMSDEMRTFYENFLIDRMDKVPKIQLIQIHEIVEKMPVEYQHELLVYLKQKFTKGTGVKGERFENELDEIDSIISQLPKVVRDQIHESLHARFAETAVYNIPNSPEVSRAKSKIVTIHLNSL